MRRGLDMSGLVLISLPIGNSDDITLRALKVLKEETHFYAEDTRVFKELLQALNISLENKVIESFHDHAQDKVERIVQKIKGGQKICLVSDAGSPVISDPAYPLIRKVVDEGLELMTVPGVSSVVVGLELSGLPPHPFTFHGFLGRSEGEKKEFFMKLAALGGTHLFFESPHRIEESLGTLAQVLPEAQVSVMRELTKTFESVYRFIGKDWEAFRKDHDFVVKGEFVVGVYLPGVKQAMSAGLKSEAAEYLEKPTTKKLAKLLAEITGETSKEIYARLNRSENRE